MTYLKLVNYLRSGVKLTVCLVGETSPWRGLTLLVLRNLVTWVYFFTSQWLTIWKKVECFLAGETRPWRRLTILALKCTLVTSGHPLKLVNYLLSGVKLTVCLVGETRPWSGLTLLVRRLGFVFTTEEEWKSDIFLRLDIWYFHSSYAKDDR